MTPLNRCVIHAAKLQCKTQPALCSFLCFFCLIFAFCLVKYVITCNIQHNRLKESLRDDLSRKARGEKQSDVIICSHSSHTVQRFAVVYAQRLYTWITRTHTNKHPFSFAHIQQLRHPHADAFSVDPVSYFCLDFRVSQRRAECWTPGNPQGWCRCSGISNWTRWCFLVRNRTLQVVLLS